MACDDKNPLIREGVDRMTRRLAALSPESAPVDGRSMEDLMLFAKRYATFIKFKNEANEEEGTWEDLMKLDISVILSVLLAIDVFQIADYIKLLYKNTKLAISENDDPEARRNFKYLFDLVFTLVKIIDNQCSLLKDEPEYQLIIKSVIQNKLNSPFSKLHNFKKEYPDLILMSNKTDAAAPLITINSRASLELDNFLITDEKLKITVPGANPLEKISHVITHNLFNNQITLLLGEISSILSNAQQLLGKSLTEYSKHEPHYALFLTFLKLFQFAQDSLNQYTKNHQNFYYKDVLRLKNQSPRADKAHLVLGLQKHISNHLLEKGTLFKGGKDLAGKERFYSLSENVVFNQAQVSQIKAFQIHQKNLLAFSVANSADGQGENFEGEDKSWFAFGNPKAQPTSESGFAIASNLLFLKEGHRTIEIKVIFATAPKFKFPFINPKFSKKSISIPFEVTLTGENEWITKYIKASYQPLLGSLVLKIIMDVGEDAIVPYSEKTHEINFDTTLPLMMAKLDQQVSQVWYTDLMNTRVSSIQVSVDVKGVRDLALSSDRGSVDASKPFKPFGDFPKSGTGFYIGSKEIFQKKLDSLEMNFQLNAAFTCNYLHKNTWKSYIVTKLPNDRYRINKPLGANLLETTKMDFGPNQLLKATSFEGYLRLQLNTSHYSLDSYMKKVSEYVDKMIKKAQPKEREGFTTNTIVGEIKSAFSSVNQNLTDVLGIGKVQELEKAGISIAELEKNLPLFELLANTGNTIPIPDEITSDFFSLDYKASENITSVDSNEEKNCFYHLTPFGYYRPESSENLSLIPHFGQQGELLIGIEKAEAPVTVQLLFLLVEGSSNPLKNQEQVSWHYMNSGNQWITFEKGRIIDGTINLTRSGIVSVNFPKDAGRSHTALPTDHLWIRASVAKNTDAVCRVIDIQAQGALVELVQSSETEFRQILQSGSIAKLKNSDSAVKSINQPMDSIQGRVRESDPDYYVRVSERLRHKQRAKGIWDYEHLLLQEFPEIHKVKCLNHSGFYEQSGSKVFCENYPGNITVVCIPDLKEKSHINPLRPYTPVGLLTDIHLFLEKIKNPFATLHVVNPRFEEVQVDFEVSFHEFMDEVFYRNLLDREIEQFLCPWAFDFNQKIILGGSINKSSLINFVEERPYVDFINCFKLHHIIRNDVGTVIEKKSDLEEVTAASGRSVLVSHFDEKLPEARHKIKVIQTCTC